VRKIILVTAVALGASLLAPPAANAVDDVNTERLRKAITANGILAHERVFQRIANEHGGHRAAGTPGYGYSARYVKRTLMDAGYEVTRDWFQFPYFEELAPAELEQVDPEQKPYQTGTFTQSGSGEVVGEVIPTNDVMIPPPEQPGSTSGCEPEDFPDPGNQPAVALIQRGTCNFGVKAALAEAAGYDAVIIFNEGQAGRTELIIGGLGDPVGIPVVGLSFEDGAELYELSQDGGATVRVETSTVSEMRKTRNILADTPGGDPEKVVVVGAHLDSVTEGAGINDNGSGSAAILEVAQEMARLGIEPRQKIRFAFWSAEELSLLGSTAYVNGLSDRELATIYANLNFDMLGSTNYVRFVYDGDGSGGGPVGPPGSAELEEIFTRYFADEDLASDPTPFNGRSDYGPFIAVGIPAGGLFSGAEGIKTEEQAAEYGGTAGQAYDPCYHQACDTMNNVSPKALGEMGDAVAHAVMTMARTRDGLFDDGSRPERRAVPMDTFDYAGGQLVR
jgi:Zn-dependent M28 family amino/carboxypeptidase